jgi:hypothetical protein
VSAQQWYFRGKNGTIRQGLAAMNQGMGSDRDSPSSVAACLGKTMLTKTELLRLLLQAVSPGIMADGSDSFSRLCREGEEVLL